MPDGWSGEVGCGCYYWVLGARIGAFHLDFHATGLGFEFWLRGQAWRGKSEADFRFDKELVLMRYVEVSVHVCISILVVEGLSPVHRTGRVSAIPAWRAF